MEIIFAKWRLIIVTIWMICAVGSELSLTHYTPSGGIAQVEYASIAVRKCAPVIGWLNAPNRSILVKFFTRHSPLSQPALRSTYCRNKVGFVAAGLEADCGMVCSRLNLEIAQHKLIFGETMPVRKLAHRMGKWLSRPLRRAAEDKENSDDFVPVRCFACHSLLTVYDHDSAKAVLCRIDNSGSVRQGTAFCLGGLTSKEVNEVELLIGSSMPLADKVCRIIETVRQSNLLSSLEEDCIGIEVILLDDGDDGPTSSGPIKLSQCVEGIKKLFRL